MKRFGQLLIMILLSCIMYSCNKNHSPVIIDVSMNPNSTSAGAIYTFTVDVMDEDDDELSYKWTASGGSFVSETNMPDVRWRSPSSGMGQTFTVSVEVSDGEYMAKKDVAVLLSEPIRGSVSGYVYFSSTSVPVDHAEIRVRDKITYSNENGSFFLDSLIAGIDTLFAQKTEYSSITLPVQIPENQTLQLQIEMLSIQNSSKVFGKVRDQIGDVISNARIVFLNPDKTESRIKTVSDDKGVYRLSYIPHGERSFLVEKETINDYRYSKITKEITLHKLEQQIDFVITKEAMSGSFIDARDNHQYFFRTIGDQTWMTSNLAYLPDVSGSTELSTSSPHYYIYGYQGANTSDAKATDNYSKYGVLYNWKAAVTACPDGWHLPSKNEWSNLFNTLKPKAGYKLKATTGWSNRGNGDNSSGFSALPSGYLTKDGDFKQLESYAYFQSATEENPNSSTFMFIFSESDEMAIIRDSKKRAYAVRCIRN